MKSSSSLPNLLGSWRSTKCDLLSGASLALEDQDTSVLSDLLEVLWSDF